MSHVVMGVIGAVCMFLTFAFLKFTPHVNFTDVQRALSVCKGSEWVRINKEDITCKDGAVYPRYSKEENK